MIFWQSDGTPAGTTAVRDLAFPAGSGGQQAVPAGPHLFFPAYDRATGTELWAIDAP